MIESFNFHSYTSHLCKAVADAAFHRLSVMPPIISNTLVSSHLDRITVASLQLCYFREGLIDQPDECNNSANGKQVLQITVPVIELSIGGRRCDFLKCCLHEAKPSRQLLCFTLQTFRGWQSVGVKASDVLCPTVGRKHLAWVIIVLIEFGRICRVWSNISLRCSILRLSRRGKRDRKCNAL